MSKFQPDDIVKYINCQTSIIGMIIRKIDEAKYDKEIYTVKIILHPNSELIGYVDYKHEDNLELLYKE